MLSVLLAPGSFASIPPETADTIRALLTTTEQQAQSIKRLQRDVTALKKVVQIQGTELKSQENAIAIVTNKINNHSLPGKIMKLDTLVISQIIGSAKHIHC